MGQLFGLWREEGKSGSEEQERTTNPENTAPLEDEHVFEEFEWRPVVAQSEEGEPGSGGEEENPNPENTTPLEVAESPVLEDDNLCKLDACIAIGQKALYRGDYCQAERLLQEGNVLAADMHFDDDFRLQTLKRRMWAAQHRCLSFVKLLQGKVIQSVEEMQEAMRVSEYKNAAVEMQRCKEVFCQWLVIDQNIRENKEALHEFVMKARTVAEACHRQGNHDAALIETWPVIAALEALRRVGDDSFATDDTLRHFYVLNGLALCDKDVQTADYYCKKAFEYDAFEDLEAVRLALRVNKRKGDIRTALKYARDGARISPQDREMRKEMDRQTAFLPSDPSVIIHSNSISNDSEAEATVLREQATSSANGVSKKRSKIPKKEHSGAVNRKKKKPKMKSYTRRGHQPVDQSTTGNEELLTPGSGKGPTSSQQENQAINQTKHIETTSERAFRIVSNNYEIRLACDDCAKETDNNDSTRGYQLIDVAGHKCREEKLFLRKKNESCSQKDWAHVTSRPPKCNLSDGLCDCTAQGCRRPHNACEQELWKWHSKNNVNSQDLTRDMRSSSAVRAMYIVSKLLGNQRYIFVCKTCFEKDHDTPVTKKLHRPVCKNGHDWAKNEVCVFEEVNTNDTTTYSRQEIDNIVTPQDLVIECSRSRQRQISEINTPTFSNTLTYRPTQLDIFSNASSSSEEDETDATCFESIRSSVCEDDGLNITSPEGDIFYEIYEKHNLENLLNIYADTYKRCTLRLTGRHSAVCTPEVVANNFAKIEIKGRTNCGPTFDGDEVVVEIFQTKELDQESTVLSGRVAGVLGGCVRRRSLVFVCTVDEYLSCLMVPRCGTAPKLHIIDSYVKDNYSGPIRNQLVTVYKRRDGNLQQKCIERLNPKDRQSKLFVVRYINWKTRFMYPLGCVVKAIEPGRDLQRGQRILNLQYQVQRQFPADVVSYAEDSREPKLLDGRRDLREEYTFTIDPPGCTDIDDALSVRRLGRNGHEIYQVDVHIADVTHYIERADPVDIESRRRGTTFYPAVGCSAFHMLPQRLSEDLCSLLPGKDRLALSVQLILDNDGNLLEPNPTISRTVINSNAQLTYTEVHEMLLSTRHSEGVDEELRRRLTWLHHLSQRLREKRLQDKRFFSEYGGLLDFEDKAAEAHELIEEFMVLANREIAKFLIGKFPDCTPLRRQGEPKEDDLQNWRKKHAAVARGTFYFQSFNDLMTGCDEREDVDFPLLTDTTRQLTEAVEAGDMARATTLVSLEQLHPEFALLFPSWYGIQERSEYIRSGNGASCRHFTLREDVYTHFTSPIRRYFDTVVHRLVKAAIDGQSSPYTCEEIDQMCRHLNYQMRQQKKYDNDLKSLRRACSLNSTAMFLPGVVEYIGDGHFSVYLPHLRLRKEVKYSLLGVRAALTPECVDDSPPGKVTLYWSRKIFDAGGCTTHARTSCAVSESLRLDSYTHVDRVPRNSWNDVRRAVSTSDTESLLPAINNMLGGARSSSNELPPEVTSEMKTDEPLWRKACDFQVSLKTTDILLLQVGAELVRGLLEPTVRLVNLTRQLDLCIEHTDQPVKCFAEIAILHSKKSYQDVAKYQEIWLPILAMEAAEGAVKEGEPIVVHNVNVTVRWEDNNLCGRFTLPKAFCKSRHIPLIENMKQDEDETENFLCIRCALLPDQRAQRQSRNVWVGHALTQKAYVINEDDDDDDSGEIVLEFRVQHSNTDPPPAVMENDCGSSCTVELIPKLQTDRRKEDAVRDLQGASKLCKAIVLAKPTPNSDPGLDKLCPKDLQIETARSSSKVYLPRSNDSQLKAIRTSLTANFTVVQGPPGTGKTQTAGKLAYWFVQMNRRRANGSDGTTRRQVLYCGPSNGAVDVAAKLLQDCFGNKAPKILRIYSEELERQVFPIPRESPVRSGHGRRFELIGSEDQKKIALHYLIRKPGNEFSERIAKYDKLFSRNMDSHYNVDDKEIERYSKLVTDAAIHEIKQYDILLCTCSHSASPRIKRAANVTQCIIDECGMCTEPESLIPLTCHKPQQVVLIGDHKQLRPIVKQPTAKELGLEISLFERYAGKAILLDMQYRMHPAICEFPSRQFYDGRLKTAEGFNARSNFGDYLEGSKNKLQVMWPNRQLPLVFCHVEGAERSLVISSSEGNEASKSNIAERDHAVRIFAHLVNYCGVPQNKVTVLSQYRAQCSEITRNLEEVYGFERPNVSTVIASQGDEWDYVIMSTVRSMPRHEIDKRPTIGWLKTNLGFISDQNQINVALTRAKKGLIIIGNQHVLRCSGMWRDLLNEYQATGCLVDVLAFPRAAPVLNEGRRMRQTRR